MIKYKRFLIAVFLVIFFIRCEQDSIENYAEFVQQEYSITSESNAVNVILKLQRPAEDNTPVTINMQTDGLLYNDHFSIDPAASELNGRIFITFAKGTDKASFKVIKLSEPKDGEHNDIKFTIATAASPVKIGTNSIALIYL